MKETNSEGLEIGRHWYKDTGLVTQGHGRRAPTLWQTDSVQFPFDLRTHS